MSQQGRILRYCEEHDGITRAEALNNLAVGNLPARINEMIDNYVIDKTWERGVNEFGEEYKYIRYRIKGERHV